MTIKIDHSIRGKMASHELRKLRLIGRDEELLLATDTMGINLRRKSVHRTRVAL